MMIRLCAFSLLLLGACSAGEGEPRAVDAGTDATLNDAGYDSGTDSGGEQCESHACFCERLCKKIEVAGCPLSPPRGDCVKGCEADNDTCPAQAEAWLQCVAELSQVRFSCDLDGYYVASGCAPEMSAIAECAATP
jgi:hypothetical protein